MMRGDSFENTQLKNFFHAELISSGVLMAVIKSNGREAEAPVASIACNGISHSTTQRTFDNMALDHNQMDSLVQRT